MHREVCQCWCNVNALSICVQVVLAHTVITSLSKGLEPAEAGAEALDLMFRRVGGSGGVIIIDKLGR